MDIELKKIIDKSKSIVFFGGAGVSTESGIPDFRSEDGLYSAREKYGVSPETILSHSYFMHEMHNFFEYYMGNLVYKDAKPNEAHKTLAYLEGIGKVKGVVTQNIDGLHQEAGSKNVYELHGSIHRNTCMKCGSGYDLDFVTSKGNQHRGIPICPKCGGVIKPDVVLYEEALNQKTLEDSVRVLSKADTLIVGGTSLQVYPAAGLVRFFNGDNLVLINKGETSLNVGADLVIRDSIGKVMKIDDENFSS